MEQSRAITRKSASNLALAFIMLPREKRDAMSALYAFCREVDDVADADAVPLETRRSGLVEWRADIKRACNHDSPNFPVNRELQPIIQKYRLPFSLFDELIHGCEMDLDIRRYETWPELELYCHRVASVVGLLSIEIFGYSDAGCGDYARALGQALQLTNILRDVRNDAERGRIYLPLEELRRHGVSELEILENRYTPRYQQLAASVAGRAREHYHRARGFLPIGDRRSMVAAELMGALYWRLLRQLESKQFDVFGSQPVRLSKPYKLALIFQSWLRFAFGVSSSNYGST